MTNVLLDTDAITVVSAERSHRSGRPEQGNGWDCVELVLLRRGCFSYRDGRGQVFVDPTTCRLLPPLQVGELTHPTTDGDLASMPNRAASPPITRPAPALAGSWPRTPAPC